MRVLRLCSLSPKLAVVAALAIAAAAETWESVAKQADAAREGNRAAQAVRLYRRGVALRPNWAEGWWYFGSLLYDQKQYAEAAGALERFLKLEPQSGAGWTLAGLNDYQLKRYERALERLTAAQALDLPRGSPLSNAARYYRAVLKTRAGRFEAAFDELKRFPFLAGDSPAVVQAIGMAGLRLALLPEDLPAGQREIVMKTGRAVYDCWAVRIADADGEFREVILTYPENPHLRYLYGAFLLESRPEDGLRELRKCLELDATYVPAMLQIAYAYLKWGQPAQGLPYAEKAAALQPDSFVAHHALGRLLADSGDLARGTRELERAVKLAPDQAEVRFALASAYGKAGREEDAAREKAEFLRLDKARREAAKR